MTDQADLIERLRVYGIIRNVVRRTVDVPDIYPTQISFDCRGKGRCIWMSHPADGIKGLIGRNSVVAPATIKIRFDFPLKKPTVVEVTEPKPITRGRLAEIVAREYAKIYQEEAATTTIPVGALDGMYNRNMTDGTYGVWGFELGNLTLRDIYVKGGIYMLDIDS